MKHVVIIGNGISGITAARHIRKLSNHRITVISAETDHFFSRTALMYIYMGHMKYQNTKPYEDWFWKKNRIELVRAFVEKVDYANKTLHYANGGSLQYDDLVLAVGSKPNKFGWPGQDLKGVSGMYSYQDLQAIEQYTQNIKHAVIVGGGLIGIELAEMLHSRHIPVTFLVRESSFWNGVLPAEESDLINRHIREQHGVDLRLSAELKEILADEQGRARAVITNTGEEIACQYVGLTAGVSPNIDFLKGTELEVQRGILVDAHLRTNLPDVYSIGDCAQHRNPKPHRRPLEQVWYTGRMMGECVAHTICGKPTEYTPGVWFNSAKFFDIEYQTYGYVLATLNDNEAQFYWERPDGRACIKIVYDKNTLEFIGINNFGIRLRHEVFDRWLTAGQTVTYVLEHLREANFDPEFYKRYEQDIINAWNSQQPGHQVTLKGKKGIIERIFG